MTHRMLALLLTTALCPISTAGVNGSLETIGDITVLNLWGNWEEMGYAHGYLLGPDQKELFETYFLEFAGGPGNIDLARLFLDAYFEIPDEFRSYAAGMVSGIADTVGTWSDVYGRDLDTLDLYLASAVPDISHLIDAGYPLCSSISAWGEATSADPDLLGEPGIARNLDYWVDEDLVLYDHHLLITYDPDDAQEWVSIGFSGLMGCLSGMNQAGVNGTIDMGNHQGTYQTSSPFVPICMALALGLCREDFDGSGSCDIDDLLEATTCWNRSNSYDVHCTGAPGPSHPGEPAIVVEISNERGTAVRLATDEPAISTDRMILTNHHRVLYPPVYCSRYTRLLDSLTANPVVGLERLWVLAGCAGTKTIPGLGGTIQTMIFMPSQMAMGVSFSDEAQASWQKSPE
ncbi:hypothetical protein JW921_10475, partial [Candidatus Fermentibacterales bacterium]|nr:hypothetical protein [Candidatus Fermentibacterales bacterium]